MSDAMADLGYPADPFAHGPCRVEACTEPAVLVGGLCAPHLAEAEQAFRMKAAAEVVALRERAESKTGKHTLGRTLSPSAEVRERRRRKLAAASRAANRRHG